jgi:hypothetical protein
MVMPMPASIQEGVARSAPPAMLTTPPTAPR